MQPRDQLLLTKLLPPAQLPSVICRSRLLAQLQTVAQRRITLVSAPAGYGKTILLRQFLDAHPAAIWYGLDDRDRNLPTFLLHLLTVFSNYLGGFCDDIRDSLASGQDLPTDAILGCIVNEFTRRSDRSVFLLLDGYHEVESCRSVNHVVEYFLRYLPSSVHLVISCRGIPRLDSLPKLQASGMVAKVGEPELAFTRAETLELCENLGACTEGSSVDTLLARTLGWPIGITTLAVLMHASSESASSLDEAICFNTDCGTLADYFRNEVLFRESLEMQSFLMRASVLPHLSANVCNTVLGTALSPSLLRQADRRKLFLNKTSANSFELHPLFRSFLGHRLAENPAESRDLHLQAARFFEQNEDAAEAASHYLEAEDYDEAIRVMSAASESWLKTRKFGQFISLVDRIPGSVRDKEPDLVMATGRAFVLQGRFTEALSRYEKAYEAYCSNSDSVGASRALRVKGAILCMAQTKHLKAEALHRHALGVFEDHHMLERADSLRSLSFVHMSAGNSDSALELYNSALQIYVDDNDEIGQMKTLVSPGAYVHMLRGDFSEALALLRRAESLALEFDSRQRLVECYNLKASVLMFLGRYPESLACAEKAQSLAHELGSINQEAWALTLGASSTQKLGAESVSEIAQRHQQALRLAELGGTRRVMVIILAGLSDLHRSESNPDLAVSCAKRAVELIAGASDQWLSGFTLRHLGAAQIQCEPEEGLRTLSDALTIVTRCSDKFNLSYAHYWLAVLHKMLGRVEEQMRHTRECVDLAATYGYTSIFEEKSLVSAQLLADALCSGVRPDFTRRMLVRTGVRATEALLPQLFSADERVRLGAVRALGQVGDARALASLQVLTKDNNADVRIEASDAIRGLLTQPALSLKIRLFGSVTVQIGETVVDTSAWKRRKVVSLLAYLALNRSRGLQRDVLIDKLWPGMDYQAAHNNLRVTMHDLRQCLEPYGRDSDQWRYVIYKDDRYALHLGQDGVVDVEAFRIGLEAAERERDPAEAINKYEAALRLYAGDLLEDMPYEDWCRVEREGLRELYLTNLAKVGSLYELKGDLRSALACYNRILATDDSREDIHRQLILLHSEMGNRVGAVKQYRQCTRILRDELGVSPSRETTLAYEKALSFSPSSKPSGL